MKKSMLPILFLSAFSLLLPCLGMAQSDSLLYLDNLIEEAKANNPELQALWGDREAAESKVSWFSYVPDPVVAAEFGSDMKMYSVTQQLPFPLKISRRSDIALNETEISDLLYESKMRMLIRDLKKDYAALLLIYGRISVARKSIVFLKQVYSIARHKFSINEAAQAEVLMVQVRLAQVENQLVLLHDDLQIVQAHLNFLLNRDPEEILAKPVEPVGVVDTLTLLELYAMAEANQPTLQASEAKRKEAELKLSMAKQTYLPDIMFRYTLEHMDTGMNNNKYMFGLTVPLWFLDKQRKSVQEASARLRSADARYRLAENSARVAVKQAKTKLEKYQKTINIYRNAVLPQVETALKSALSAYQVGKVDFQTLLESERLLVETEFQYEEARANLFIARAELEEIVGLEL